MRRKDGEITDRAKIQEIISNCHCCRVGFCDEGEVYIVPLNFGYVCEENEDIFYFHGAKEGRKIDLIGKNPHVGFEMDTHYLLQEGKAACDYTARFQSVIGNGVMSIVTEESEKIKGLSAIMKQETGKSAWDFDAKWMRAVCVFKLVVEKMTCKEHL